MSFLPDDYKAPAGTSKYMKFKKGENKFRILSKAIVGYEAWTHDNKPVRKKPGSKFELSEYKSLPKHFWAFVVWNYTAESIQILNVTQITIQNAIESCSNDEEWGNPLKYDFKVTRVGDSKDDTKYTVTPSPHKELTKEVTKQYESMEIDLEKLFEGLDPFGTEKLEGVKAPDEAPGFKKDKSDLPF